MRKLFYWLFPLYGWYMFKWIWGFNDGQIKYLIQKNQQIKEIQYRDKYVGCSITVDFWGN